MKAWRRRSTDRSTSVAVDCGQQPGELDLQEVGATTVDLFWDWPFGASSLIIEEADAAAPAVWVLVVNGVNAADDFHEWVSSFAGGTTIRARIRRTGSDVSCAVVSNDLLIG